MNAENVEPTPQERLAMSRHALVQHLRQEHLPGRRRALRPRDRTGDATTYFVEAATAHPAAGWLKLGQRLAGHWWRRHPLHAAGQLARPLLERAAHERPVALMVAAAATGGVLVLTRPWRLLTVSAAIAALFKTSELAGVINTLMHREPFPRKDLTP